uniref:Uncharacterized protein n=1 Tax=Ascaris lumbricoides TaxID=6252 RepID=A0A0M3I040_ASCLU
MQLCDWLRIDADVVLAFFEAAIRCDRLFESTLYVFGQEAGAGVDARATPSCTVFVSLAGCEGCWSGGPLYTAPHSPPSTSASSGFTVQHELLKHDMLLLDFSLHP